MATERLPQFQPGDIVRHYGEPARVLSLCWVVDYRTNAVWKHAPHWRCRIEYLTDGDHAWVVEDSLTDSDVIATARRMGFHVIEGGARA